MIMNNIALPHLQTPIPNHQITTKCFKPKTPILTTITTTTTIPARDRIIYFGKHKGKMLGSLPSSYLKWVSKNLRTRDLEDWAKLADQVLQDPVYQDRLEWEFAQNALDGNRTNSSSSISSGVSDLVEISERFGWDNEDKIGWSGVNFELLGTSKSGRIPRLGGKDGGKRERKEGGKVEGESGGRRRSERRERVRLRMKREKKLGIVEKGRGNLGNESISSGNAVGFFEKKNEMVGEINNPFPGREALLKNVMLQKSFL